VAAAHGMREDAVVKMEELHAVMGLSVHHAHVIMMGR